MERNEFSSETSPLGQTEASSGVDSSATNANDRDRGLADRARGIAGTAQEKLADVGSSVRERAGSMKNSLADVLTSGADKLRHRGSTAPYAGATDAGTVDVESDERTAQVTNKVASGMDATADWLREADLAGVRTSIESQVKEHPGRSLLIAAGLGYLLGRALRK